MAQNPDDAFARYLAGFAYEADGNYNDAYIDYQAAYAAYLEYEKRFGLPVPDQVKADLLFIGAYGHSRIIEMVLGSTTEYVLRNSSCPVFLNR